ncbi:tetratricopeptide repeat protein [Nocardiopsis oceani]
MNGPETVNTAGPDAFVGVQAGQIHHSNVYVVGPDDPPEQHFDVGVSYLENGVPDKARDHIEKAVTRGYDGPRVRFHLILALLSKRSYRDLDKKDRTTLRESTGRKPTGAGDEWQEALTVVSALVACVDGSGGDPDEAMAKLGTLPHPQHELTLHHLGLVLTGSMKQGVWYRIRDTARGNRTAHERVDRVWAYFEPEPAPARAQKPRPKSTSGWDTLGGLLLAAALLFPVAVLVRAALGHGSMTALLACLSILVFVPAASWHVAYWNHKQQRVLADLKEAGRQRAPSSLPQGGFTDHVRRRFDHYFAKYAPDPRNRSAWLEETKEVRHALRDEVARVYRESDVRSGQVNWLIRFVVREVRQRWREGLPLKPREVHSVDTATKARCVILCLFSVLGTAFVIGAAFQHAPISTVGCVLLVGVLGRFALPLWLRLHSERRRHAEESREQAGILQAREAEYKRWKEKLAALMPTETEMEKWLNADKTLILDEALQHFRLDWHEIVAHAFLPTPDQPCKSAKLSGGPWRHSRYEVRIFLVTSDGVREVSADLDFLTAGWEPSERDNYRFDALSSVHVEMTSEHRYTLNITLTNGPTKSTVVSETPPGLTPDGEEPDETAKINLEAAGFPHTLRILEGIAAEGKPWFDRTMDPSHARASERPGTDAPSDAGTTSSARNGTDRRERPTYPHPDRAAPVQ